MGLYGMMRTSVSGMAAQANRLSAVADNIANSDTTGFKRYTSQFSQLVTPGVRSEGAGEFNSGGVLSYINQAVSDQGPLNYTTSATDLAVAGNGFFVVNNQDGTPMLTRAGSFVPDSDGRLVNTAGMVLTGYNLENGPAAAVANGFAGLEEVVISESDLIANPTTQGTFQANLPSEAVANSTALPSANLATSDFTQKTSLVVYDNLGASKLMDLYFTKSAGNTWELAVFDQETAATGTAFPYSSGPLATQTLTFDPTTGDLSGGTSITFTVPNGASTTLDLADMTQLAADYTPFITEVNGNSPSQIKQIDFSDDGTMYARYEDGSFRALYQVPLATVVSVDQLKAETGSIFVESQDSGSVQLGFAGQGGFGVIVPSALEQSNVDLAEELTSMIQSQRGYTANSKVFQTGSDLMDVLVNLKR